ASLIREILETGQLDGAIFHELKNRGEGSLHAIRLEHQACSGRAFEMANLPVGSACRLESFMKSLRLLSALGGESAVYQLHRWLDDERVSLRIRARAGRELAMLNDSACRKQLIHLLSARANGEFELDDGGDRELIDVLSAMQAREAAPVIKQL